MSQRAESTLESHFGHPCPMAYYLSLTSPLQVLFWAWKIIPLSPLSSHLQYNVEEDWQPMLLIQSRLCRQTQLMMSQSNEHQWNFHNPIPLFSIQVKRGSTCIVMGISKFESLTKMMIGSYFDLNNIYCLIKIVIPLNPVVCPVTINMDAHELSTISPVCSIGERIGNIKSTFDQPPLSISMHFKICCQHKKTNQMPTTTISYPVIQCLNQTFYTCI